MSPQTARLCGDALDLYVINYVEWTPDSVSNKRIPSPMDFHGLSDHLYHNSGNGEFLEVGSEAGVSLPQEGKGLAVAISDGLTHVLWALEKERTMPREEPERYRTNRSCMCVGRLPWSSNGRPWN